MVTVDATLEAVIRRDRLVVVTALIAVIALFVLFEKTVPAGHWLGYATGVALLVWGAGMLALAF